MLALFFRLVSVTAILVSAAALLLSATAVRAEPVRVRFRQGSAHGFLALRTLDGTTIATGDATQTMQGDRVISRLTFRFRDGSIDDDTTVFTQDRTFRLISDHHIQHGPAFPKPTDILIDALSGQITSRTEKGELRQDHLDLPPDVANGLPPNLLLNILPSAAETRLSYVAPLAKPRLVHLSIKPAGNVAFKIGGLSRKAIDYVVHVELGGVTAVVAPLIGKQPDDIHIWILAGAHPAFIREEGQMYEGGPVWRIEQISPTFDR